MSFSLYFAILGTIAWLLVYVECIRLGFKNKLCYMPLYALAMNLPWEVMGSYIEGREGDLPYFLLDFSWLLLDIPIAVIWFCYGRMGLKDSQGNLISQKVFVAYSLLAFLIGTLFIAAFVKLFGQVEGLIYIAQLMLLLMAGFVNYRIITKSHEQWPRRMIIFQLAGDLLYYIGFCMQYDFIFYVTGICILLDIVNLIASDYMQKN